MHPNHNHPSSIQTFSLSSLINVTLAKSKSMFPPYIGKNSPHYASQPLPSSLILIFLHPNHQTQPSFIPTFLCPNLPSSNLPSSQPSFITTFLHPNLLPKLQTSDHICVIITDLCYIGEISVSLFSQNIPETLPEVTKSQPHCLSIILKVLAGIGLNVSLLSPHVLLLRGSDSC